MLAASDCLQFDTRKGGAANQLDRMRSYRDFRPAFFAGRRVAEVRRALRVGFAVAVFLEALRALAVFALGFVDCFFFVVELFFFGDAAFAFRVVRLLAAPIAGPERAPITVPTTGTPSEDASLFAERYAAFLRVARLVKSTLLRAFALDADTIIAPARARGSALGVGYANATMVVDARATRWAGRIGGALNLFAMSAHAAAPGAVAVGAARRTLARSIDAQGKRLVHSQSAL